MAGAETTGGGGGGGGGGGAEDREQSVDMCFCQPGVKRLLSLLSAAVHQRVPLN